MFRRDILHQTVLNPKDVVGVALKITKWQIVQNPPSVETVVRRGT